MDLKVLVLDCCAARAGSNAATVGSASRMEPSVSAELTSSLTVSGTVAGLRGFSASSMASVPVVEDCAAGACDRFGFSGGKYKIGPSLGAPAGRGTVPGCAVTGTPISPGGPVAGASFDAALPGIGATGFTDGSMRDALPTVAAFDPARAAQQPNTNTFKSMPGMSLDQTNTAAAALYPQGVNRTAALAATSERLGMQARPASDFSGRFASPQATAPIATGSNPTVKSQPVSTGPQAVTPQAPIDTAVTDNVSETAELPPALVGPLSLRMAASKGDPSAAFEVATRLAEGRGIKQDFKQAMTWYQRSANKGFAVAQYRLGTLYERGLGTPIDTNRARVWYKRAADQGNVKAMHNMAVLSAGNGQTAPDYVSAAKWFKDAADRGLADSQFNLGVLNESGLGIQKDLRAAYVWFSLAARQGDAEAARRRDLLLASVDAETLKSAEEQLKGWRTRPVDQRLNDPRVAGDQWRNQALNQQEPTALAVPVPPEAQRANAAAAPTPTPAAPAVQARVIKAPAVVR
jgi:localization factor PodJL